MRGYSNDRDQQFLADLAEQARMGSAPETSAPTSAVKHRSKVAHTEASAAAEARWQAIKNYPMIAIVCLLAISACSAPLLGGLSMLGCIAPLFLGVCAIFGIIRLNVEHQSAFLEWQMSKGIDEAEARRMYNHTYSD